MKCNPAPHQMKQGNRIFLSVVFFLCTLTMLSATFAADAPPQDVLPPQGVLTTPRDIVMGRADAPIKVIEYSSMTCHFCADFHTKTLPRLKEKYIDTGRVQYIFRHFSPDEYGLAAAALVASTPVMGQMPLITKLFENQGQWMTPEYVKELAFLAGKPVEHVSRIVNDTKMREALAADFLKAEQNLKIEATPFFVINGVVIPHKPSFEKLETLIAPARPAPAAKTNA